MMRMRQQHVGMKDTLLQKVLRFEELSEIVFRFPDREVLVVQNALAPLHQVCRKAVRVRHRYNC